MPSPSPRIGVALGGGASRGWAHIGVLSALSEHGVEPDVVCGTSIGALVGGVYVAGQLAEFERWVSKLTRRDVLALVDFTVGGGGPIRGQRLMDFARQYIEDERIEDLPKPYAAVATDLRTGSEVWLREGSFLTAIRASISVPGLFTPVSLDGRWLADGGLVNPVPVTLCRALGADVVIAVDLNSNRTGRRREQVEVQPAVVTERSWQSRITDYLSGPRKAAPENEPPALSEILSASLYIMQDRISRSRLAGDPPDLLLTPRLQDVDPLDFAAGRSTIEEGYNTVHRMKPALQYILGLDS